MPLIKCSTYFIAKRLACAGLFVVAWFRERTGEAVESPGCECYNCLLYTSFDLIDDDKVCLTNLNRQIIATRKTVGKYKTEVMKERMLEINPDVKVEIHNCFFLPENAKDFPFEEYDYIVDAVDTVTAKIALVMKAKEMNIPIISLSLIHISCRRLELF